MPDLWAFKHQPLQPISGPLEGYVTSATALYPTPKESPLLAFLKITIISLFLVLVAALKILHCGPWASL